MIDDTFKMVSTFSAPQFKTNEYMLEYYEDWSGCRSIARAKRRRKRGHRQNVVIRSKPSSEFWHDKTNNIVYCHPEAYKKLQEIVKEVGRKTREKLEDDFCKMIIRGYR